uniref:Uncharacterized protein n=1 Tax=Zea mays TaxID=4577 RepID=A0A804UMU8_MAIZE
MHVETLRRRIFISLESVSEHPSAGYQWADGRPAFGEIKRRSTTYVSLRHVDAAVFFILGRARRRRRGGFSCRCSNGSRRRLLIAAAAVQAQESGAGAQQR